jgi:hypothetical protein
MTSEPVGFVRSEAHRSSFMVTSCVSNLNSNQHVDLSALGRKCRREQRRLLTASLAMDMPAWPRRGEMTQEQAYELLYDTVSIRTTSRRTVVEDACLG